MRTRDLLARALRYSCPGYGTTPGGYEPTTTPSRHAERRADPPLGRHPSSEELTMARRLLDADIALYGEPAP